MYFATNDVHVPRFPHERFRGKNPMGLRGTPLFSLTGVSDKSWKHLTNSVFLRIR